MNDWIDDIGNEPIKEKDEKESVSIEIDVRTFKKSRRIMGDRSTFLINSNREQARRS